jgi:GABA permease
MRILLFFVGSIFLLVPILPWNNARLGDSPCTASRVLFTLSRRGDAPLSLLEVNRRGVPMKAILTCTVVAYAAIAMAYVSPDEVFLFLLNSSGAIVLFVYLLICVAELRMRRQLEAEQPERLRLRMWMYPWLTSSRSRRSSWWSARCTSSRTAARSCC